MSPVCASVNIIPQPRLRIEHTWKAKQDITAVAKNFVLGNGFYHFDLWPRSAALRDGLRVCKPILQQVRT